MAIKEENRRLADQFSGDALEEAQHEAELADLQRQVLKKVDRHLTPWLWSLGTICYLDRTNLAFAAIQLNKQLGLSCTVYGIGAGVFFLAYATTQIPCQMALVRYGAPTWLGWMTVLWGLTATCFAMMRWFGGTALFITLRLLLGVAESSAFPGMWHHLRLFYSPSELGPAYAKVATSTALAQVVGAPLAAAILCMDGMLGLHGWQWLFVLEGLSTVAFGLVLKLRLAHSPATARCLTVEERAWLARRQAHAASEAAADASASRKAVLSVARDWRVLWLGGAWLLIAASMYGLIFWCPLMVSSMFNGHSAARTPGDEGACGSGSAGASDDTAERRRHSALVALLTAVPFAVAAAAMVVNAKLAQRSNERHRHAGVPIALGAAFLAAVPLLLNLSGPILAFSSLVLAAGAVWAFHGPFMSWPAVFLSGTEAAAGFALINSLGAVGGFLGPFLVGLLADRSGNYAAAMLLMAGLLAVAAAAILAFPVGGRSEELVVVPLQGLVELKDYSVDGSVAETQRPGLQANSDLERQPMLNGRAAHSSEM